MFSLVKLSYKQYCNKFKVKMAIVSTEKEEKSKQFLWATKTENKLFDLFNLITICPLQIDRNSTKTKIKYRKSSRLFAILAINLILLYICGIVIIRVFYLNSQSELRIWSEVLNVCGIFMTCLIIIIETQFTYKYFSDFLHMKENIEIELKSLCCRNLFETEKFLYIKDFWRYLLFSQILGTTIDIVNLINIRRDTVWRFYVACFILPITINRFRNFQHQLYTKTLNFYIKMIRVRIEQSINDLDNNGVLVKQQYQQQFNMINEKIFNDLKSSMHIFTCIFRMTCIVNKILGFSLLIRILSVLVHLFSSLFWIYSKIYFDDLQNVTGNAYACTTKLNNSNFCKCDPLQILFSK